MVLTALHMGAPVEGYLEPDHPLQVENRRNLALFAGIGRGLAPGQLHPRAVPLYNALHRLVGPAALAVASIWLGEAWRVAAMAWAAHVALDRAVGYWLRTREGFQRGR